METLNTIDYSELTELAVFCEDYQLNLGRSYRLFIELVSYEELSLDNFRLFQNCWDVSFKNGMLEVFNRFLTIDRLRRLH